jgi:polysaccharide biosynthesis transport protein
MDTIDRSSSNLPAPYSAALSASLPALGPAFSGELATTSSPQINSRTLLRGLTRHWWKILVLWVCVAVPIILAIYRFVEPTYEAVSTLLVEPNQTNMYEAIRHQNADLRTVTPYLQTQKNLLTSDKVLNDALADSSISSLSVIKNSTDPNADLKKDLSVKIIDEAYLIRIALELPDGTQAAKIVNAVVKAYLLYHTKYQASVNSAQTEELTKHLKFIDDDLKKKQAELHAYLAKGTVEAPKATLNADALKHDGDGTEPMFNTATDKEIQRVVDEIVKTGLELAEFEASLKVLEDKAANLADGQVDPQLANQVDEQLEDQIRDEFQKDPEVAALKDQINEVREERDHNKSVARQHSDPSRRVTERQLKKLQAQYEQLWEIKHEQIRGRLTVTVSGAQSPNAIDDLKIKVETLRRRKENLAKIYKDVADKQKTANHDTFEATLLDYQIKSLLKKQEQVSANLSQLAFDDKQETYRIQKVDEATVPKTPTNNKHIKYMLAAAVGVLFMVLGLFMFLEIRSERIDDPDTLSNRVRSEVYALPPLPTTRSMRKLSALQADDQIDQFIQRLDLLRFAVCGNSTELGKGRCVLITSAVAGEGKTHLAVQLALRCGKARMSTLLIDADLRRSDLCSLLDVDEGVGLSDVLRDLPAAEDVEIPIQDGIFYLLRAGTPIPDCSRALQDHSFGLLITRLRQRYDLIIIDSPPVLPVPDALILGRWTDGAVLAARYDISRFPLVERARRQLDNAGIAVLGTVINGMRNSATYYGRYSYSRRRPSSQPNSPDTI